MKRRLAFVLCLLWLLPGLACNLPTAPTPGADDVRRAVEATLAALGTAGPQQAETLAPLPDLPTPPPPLVEQPPADRPLSELVGDTYQYYTQPGDTPAALALRFGVEPAQLFNPQEYPPNQMLASGQRIDIPNALEVTGYPALLLPDSEILYSPGLAGFSVPDFIQSAGGYLSTYTEQVDQQVLTGAQIVERVAQETSISPRLLLAVLEYRSGWVSGSPREGSNRSFPIGFYASDYSGLHKELTLAARQLTIGYYGWRSGKVLEIEFVNHNRLRIHPTVNAGTAALQYLFSKLYNQAAWEEELYSPGRFLVFYSASFGDPWQRALAVEPLLPDGLSQPALELPFAPGENWSFTGGPHSAWGVGSAWGGLDFAPVAVERGCTVSRFWTTAAAPGLIVRSGNGMVVLDLDGDGQESTGWVLLYLHVAAHERIPAETWVEVNQPLGHPSCEGGISTGTHVHIARKFNGEWMAADGPVPFVLSGWRAWAGDKAYTGTLVKGDQIVTARPDGSHTSLIVR